MRGWIVAFLAVSAQLLGVEHLSDKYCVSYGDPEARNEVVTYFSFTCPHCITFFETDFPRLQKRYIDTGRVRWTFHPVPGDMQTAQAMACLARLDERQRRVFFESVLPSIDLNNSEVNTRMMEMAMKHFKVPPPALNDLDEFSKDEVFQDAFVYIKSPGAVKDVPTLEVNGRVYEEVPSYRFVSRLLQTQNRGMR